MCIIKRKPFFFQNDITLEFLFKHNFCSLYFLTSFEEIHRPKLIIRYCIFVFFAESANINVYFQKLLNEFQKHLVLAGSAPNF
jgi:hypothetical protein